MQAGGTVLANILIVDDTPANLVALEAVLEPLGQRVVKARSGPEALKCILDEDFACILLDVQMPGMDGFETASLIRSRERTRTVPLLFLTAISWEEDYVLRGYTAGAVDYLVKPFNPHILRAKVKVFVDLHLRAEALRRKEESLRVREREEADARSRHREEEARGAWRESEERFRNMADNAPVLLWVTEPDGTCTYLSKPWYDYTGQTEETGLGFGWLSAVHPEDAPRAESVFRTANAQQTPFRLDYRLRRHDGEYRWCIDSASPRFGPSGEFLGYIGSVIDISDRKATEAERERILQELAEAVRLRDAFLSVASHELKTPLTPLTLRLAQLKREALGTQPGHRPRQRQVENLELAERQVKKLATLVGELLDVSRLGTGRMKLDLEPVDLAILVREMVARFEPEATRARCALQVHADAPTPGHWDRLRLEQVVSNLLSNALKYGAGRPIHLSLGSDAARARLVVRDEGIGIEPGALGRIFDKFERAVSERHYGGLGLGLYVTRQIVEALGGTVRAESTPGQGATFTVELPRQPPQDAPPPA